MQPSHLPFVWLKRIEQFIVRKQLLPSRDKITYLLLPSGVETHSHSCRSASSLPEVQKTRLLNRYSTSGKSLIAKSDAPWRQFLALISDRLNTQITASGITNPKALALKKDTSLYTQSHDRQQAIKNMVSPVGGVGFRPVELANPKGWYLFFAVSPNHPKVTHSWKQAGKKLVVLGVMLSEYLRKTQTQKNLYR